MAVYEVNDIQQTEDEEIAEDSEGYGSGFVVTHRSKLKWEWFTQPLTAHLFEFLILSANYKAKQWQGITINRGQCITSISSICEKTGLTARQARTSLKRLESTGEIKVKTTNRFTMVTVCNYSKYQLTEKQSDKQTTNKRQTNDKQTTTTNKGNKGNKENNKDNTIELPEWLDGTLWNDYLEMRKSIKKPATLKAQKIAINKLVEFKEQGSNPNAIVEQSIMNSWQGLFPLKEQQVKQPERRLGKEW